MKTLSRDERDQTLQQLTKLLDIYVITRAEEKKLTNKERKQEEQIGTLLKSLDWQYRKASWSGEWWNREEAWVAPWVDVLGKLVVCIVYICMYVYMCYVCMCYVVYI